MEKLQEVLQILLNERSNFFQRNDWKEQHGQCKFWTIDVNYAATGNMKQLKHMFKIAAQADQERFDVKYQRFYGSGNLGWNKCMTYKQFLQVLPLDLEICLIIRKINNLKNKKQ